MITDTLQSIQNGDTLSQNNMTKVMSSIMSGEWSNEQIAAFLMGISMRGETVDEIIGAARVMRDKSWPINAPIGAVDCCGTGGDASGTYNISTAVAIVSAACGVPMAKHGNRSASSKSGAADVLESLGVNLDVPQKKLEEALELYNFAFLMAPRHHAAMKYVIPVRKSLGVRTVFNILGPLANPAQTEFQLLGVFDRSLLIPIAETLRALGTKRAWVVHGSDGLDEITTTGITHIAELKKNQIKEYTLSPQDFGLQSSIPKDLTGGPPEENAKSLRGILKGDMNAYRDIVLANSAAVLMIAGKTNTLTDAVDIAATAIDSGKALETLDHYIKFTQQHGAA